MARTINISKSIFGANCFALFILVAINLFYNKYERKTHSALPLARIGSLVGQVEVMKHDNAIWESPQLGQLLREGDAIRTGPFSESVLHLAGKSSVVVSADTEFVVRKDLVQRSLFELGVGRITAAINRSSGREYEFISRGSDTIASTKEGQFSVATDGKGTLVVDNYAGKVKIRKKEKTITLKKGRRSIVKPDEPLGPDISIPTSIILEVNWPPAKLSGASTTVSGETSAGALVRVNGILVRADHDGYFSIETPLREGKNRLVINAVDPTSKLTTESSREIEVDNKPPILEVNAKDLWK